MGGASGQTPLSPSKNRGFLVGVRLPPPRTQKKHQSTLPRRVNDCVPVRIGCFLRKTVRMHSVCKKNTCFHPGSFLERLCALSGDICIISKCFLSIHTTKFLRKLLSSTDTFRSRNLGPAFKNPPPHPLPSQPARNRTERVTEDTLLDFKANYHVTKIGRVLARALPAAMGIAPPPLVEGGGG